MNRITLTITLLLCLQCSIAKAMKLPSGVFSHDQLAAAKAEAEEEGKALVFIYTDLNTN